MIPFFKNMTDEQKQRLLFVIAFLLVISLMLLHIIRQIQATAAYARAMNAIANAVDDGGPVTINIAQFKGIENGSQEN